MLEKYFQYKKHGTDFKTEVIAGVTTFLTMAYIMFLNPIILADGGFDFGGVFTATILSIVWQLTIKRTIDIKLNSNNFFIIST